ncbi:MAG: DUF58 domain-containing protein [bacterium]
MALQATVRQWMRSVRTDARGNATIGHRQVYILPTRYGLLFGTLLLAMLIGSMNYANNPAFGLTFLLTGFAIHMLYSTWYNLLGLSIRWQSSSPVFAGDIAEVYYQVLDLNQRHHQAVQVGFEDGAAAVCNVTTIDGSKVAIPFKTSRRGILRPGQLIVETRYPYGLARAWSYLHSDAEIVVYPKPAREWHLTTPPLYEGSQRGAHGVGTDDFVGHRGYHPGDSPKHINWKALASERGLLTKQFGGDRMNTHWLDFDQVDAGDVEQKLSQLCGAVIELERQGLHYGLRLPNTEIAPATGGAHQQLCLRALALYGLDDG